MIRHERPPGPQKDSAAPRRWRQTTTWSKLPTKCPLSIWLVYMMKTCVCQHPRIKWSVWHDGRMGLGCVIMLSAWECSWRERKVSRCSFHSPSHLHIKAQTLPPSLPPSMPPSIPPSLHPSCRPALPRQRLCLLMSQMFNSAAVWTWHFVSVFFFFHTCLYILARTISHLKKKVFSCRISRRILSH